MRPAEHGGSLLSRARGKQPRQIGTPDAASVTRSRRLAPHPPCPLGDGPDAIDQPRPE